MELTLPPGVTVGPLDEDTGSRTIYRHGEEIGLATRWPPGRTDDAETLYTISVGDQSYRGVYRPLMAAVIAVDALTS